MNGQPGTSTSLVLDDEGTTTDQVYEVFANEFERTFLPDAQGIYVPDIAKITYTNVTQFALNAGAGYNDLFVTSTAASTHATEVYGGTGTNAFLLGILDEIQGPLSLHGRSAISYAVFNDANVTSGQQTYTLNSGVLNRTGVAPIHYDGLVEDVLYTSEFTAASVNVQSNAANVSTYVVPGGGDLVTIGSLAPARGGTLDNIQGNLIVSSGYSGQVPSIVIDDSGDTKNHPAESISPYPSYYIYEITGLAPVQLIFGLDPATPVSILEGSGNDSMAISIPLSATGISIDGGGGNNTLAGPNMASTWNINGTDSGVLNKIAFSYFQNLVGGSASDDFQFNTAAASIGTIQGGTGAEALDYSPFTTGVNINLGNGTNGGRDGRPWERLGDHRRDRRQRQRHAQCRQRRERGPDGRAGHEQPFGHRRRRQRGGITVVELHPDQHQVDRGIAELHRQPERDRGRGPDRLGHHGQQLQRDRLDRHRVADRRGGRGRGHGDRLR